MRLEEAGDVVVTSGPEFPAPAGKLEIEQDGALVFDDRDGAKIAGPGVIRGDWAKGDPGEGGRGLAEEPADLVRGGGGDDHAGLVAGLGDDAGKGFLDLGQIGLPVGVGMGPRQQDAILIFPFCR